MGEEELQMRVAIGGREETAAGIVSGRRVCDIARQKGSLQSANGALRKKQEIITVVCFAKKMGVRRRRRMIQSAKIPEAIYQSNGGIRPG